LHAKLLDQIRKGDPRAVAFDIQVNELDTAQEDNALGFALLRSKGKTVLATTEVTEKGQPNLIFDPAALKELGARPGNASFPTDKDGIIRRFPFSVEGLKGFAIVAAEIARKALITERDMGADLQWIDYAGAPGTVTSYSYSRVLNDDVPPNVFKDKIVVVGATAPSLQNIHATPTGSLMSAPEIHANAVATAENVITVLNYYLHEMSDAILAHGGTLVCYMGDGIYAIFGAPLEQDDHADRALAASREMLLERLPKFNGWMREQGYGEGYLMGIGLNSGPVMTGNVGHERRMDYTAVGDIVNTASRIEGMTKGTPYPVLIAESTIEMMSERPTDLVYYDELEVRGRMAKLKLWALGIRKPESPDIDVPTDTTEAAAPVA
jgi:class 3 adenylate cyclase